MLPASHMCDACDGTGREHCDCGSDTCDYYFNGYSDPCPVCLGSGRISDRMPVADALADARTLILFMRDGRHFVDLSWHQCPGADLAYCDYSYGVRKYLKRRWYERAAVAAKRAASAAFCAVPGLRGE